MSAGATAQPVPARLADVRLISIIARPVRGCRPRLLRVLQSTCSSTDIHGPLRRSTAAAVNIFRYQSLVPALVAHEP
jgi:hypothetical protein